MKHLLLAVALLCVTACNSSVTLPMKVMGKRMYNDGTCVLTLYDGNSNPYVETTHSRENCAYEIGQQIK